MISNLTLKGGRDYSVLKMSGTSQGFLDQFGLLMYDVNLYSW